MTNTGQNKLTVYRRLFAPLWLWFVLMVVSVAAIAVASTLTKDKLDSGLTVGALSVSVFSLAVAASQIVRSFTAAEVATNAARDSLDAVNRQATSIDLARVSERVSRLRHLQNEGQWIRAHERYQDVRILLSNVLSQHRSIPDEIGTELRLAIQRLASIEDKVGGSLNTTLATGGPVELSDSERRTLRQIEIRIEELEAEMRASGGGGGDV